MKSAGENGCLWIQLRLPWYTVHVFSSGAFADLVLRFGAQRIPAVSQLCGANAGSSSTSVLSVIQSSGLTAMVYGSVRAVEKQFSAQVAAPEYK